MKPSALVLIPIIGEGMSADILARRRADMAGLTKLVGLAAIASAIGLVVGWPTLLLRPSLLLRSIRYFASGRFWDGQVFYFGELTPATELP